MLNNNLSGRNILITGASSGIGAHFAKIAAKLGANVILAARRAELLNDVCREIIDGGAKALAVTMDVTSEASIIAAFDAGEKEFGAIDSIIANAGTNYEKPLFAMSAEEIANIFMVNMLGVTLTLREGAKRYIARKNPEYKGRFVIISSITGNIITPGLAPYSGSKAGITHIGKILAREWAAKGINVNIVCPGYIETDLTAEWFRTEMGKRQMQKWARQRLVEMSSLDETVMFLLADASEAITGAVISIDDGQGL